MDSVPAEADSALKWNEDKYMIRTEKEKGQKQPMPPCPAPLAPVGGQLRAVGWRVQAPCLVCLVEGPGF